MDKAEIRQKMKEKRAALSERFMEEESGRILERLQAMPEMQNAKKALLYSHFAGEVRTGALVGWLLYTGRQVYLPVVNGKKILVVKLKTAVLDQGPFGITQPALEEAEVAVPAQMDVIVCPGLAFDRAGNRIGFGWGYYDGLLAGAPACKIGLAYDFQIIKKVPAEPQDVAMDIVATPREVIRRLL